MQDDLDNLFEIGRTSVAASVALNVGLLLYFVPKSRPVFGVLGTLLMIKYKIDDKK
jgi:hypothetical protein